MFVLCVKQLGFGEQLEIGYNTMIRWQDSLYPATPDQVVLYAFTPELDSFCFYLDIIRYGQFLYPPVSPSSPHCLIDLLTIAQLHENISRPLCIPGNHNN